MDVAFIVLLHAPDSERDCVVVGVIDILLTNRGGVEEECSSDNWRLGSDEVSLG